MYEPQQHQHQHLLDLQDNSSFGSDPKSWLSGDNLSQTFSTLSAAAADAATTGTVDRTLFNDLVEMVLLVQSLIDRKANTSFTRRGSVVYTKTPSRESLYKKKAGQSATLPTKKHRDHIARDQSKNASNSPDGSILSSLLSEKDKEELMTLRDQVEDLKRQLSEKEELLKSAELTKSDLASIKAEFDEVKKEAAEKDSLIKATQLQISDLKIKLADKQAAVEKLQWEATSSKTEVEKLQENLEMVQGEISSFMILIEGLKRKEFDISAGDYDVVPYPFDQSHEIDLWNETEMKKSEAAREAYIAAVEIVKEKQDEESIVVAARARSHLQSIVLKQT